MAKAAARGQSTREGQLKGKLAYMAPEQLLRKTVDRRADVYAAGVVLWEALTLRRLFTADDEGAIVAAVLQGDIPRPSELRPDLPPGIDGIVARAVSRDSGGPLRDRSRSRRGARGGNTPGAPGRSGLVGRERRESRHRCPAADGLGRRAGAGD